MKATLRKYGILLATILSVVFSINNTNAQITGASAVCVNGTTTLVAPSTTISGGSITNVSGYNVHTFTGAGTFVIPAGLNINTELLVVAGGGGGGKRHAGGGGAGGLIYSASYNTSGSQSVVIGAGGQGSLLEPNNGLNGGNSVFGSVVATGGGGGGTNNINANNGGSGGGGSNGSFGGAGTVGQGFAGGNQNNGLGCCFAMGNGGGGATGAAASTAGLLGSNGGPGFTTSMTGVSQSFAGGGGGGQGVVTAANYQGGIGGGGQGGNTVNMLGANGTPNTGGGGGGGGANNSLSGNGGDGGSGIVIVKYAQSGTGSWTSSNTAVATVNASTGAVTGVSAGSATITYSVTVGGVVNTFTKVITVSGLPVASIKANGPLAICAGTNITLSAATSALQFNGSNTVSVANGYAATDDITYEATVTPTALTAGGFNVIMNHDNYSIGAIHYQFSNGSLQFSVSGNAPQDQYCSTTFSPNTTYRIAAVYSKAGKYVKFYVNGVLTNTAVYTTTVSIIGGNSYNIGSWNGNTRFFQGTIDDIRIWNVQRTSAQILSDADAMPITTGTANLIRYYRFDEGTGTTTSDDAGNGTGTLVNNPTWVSTTPVGQTYLWSNGSTTQSISVSTAGTYGVTVTSATGCVSVSETKTVTVNPLPTATITGATNVCINTASPLVTFTGATGTAPYTFTYTINGGAQQTLISTGNTATVSAPTGVAGTFTYTLISVKDASTTTCSNTITGSSIVVVVRAIPTISGITGATIVCSGNSTTLTAASTFVGAQYKWYDAATGGNLLASGATYTTAVLSNTSNYYVELIAAPYVCAATRTLVTVTVNALPIATITASGATAVCPSSTVILNANTGTGFTYQWSKDAVSIPGATSSAYNATTTGSYAVVITNSNGCVSAVSNAIAVTVSDNIAPTFTSAQSNITTNATSINGAVVTYILPTATDNCTATPIVTAVPASGSIFPIGTTSVTVTATDAVGNSVNTTFNIVVSGTVPVIAVPANSTLNATAGQCTATASFAATETTGIPASTITYTENGSSISSGTALSVGVHTITATATNAVGVSSGTFTVTVKDVQAPSFSGNISNAPASILANVPEASQYKLVYQLNVPNAAQWSSQAQIPYTVNNAAALAGASFNRVAYYMELDNGKWVWVSMDKFTSDPSLIGIPTGATVWQQKVNNMNVFASANAGVTTGTNIATGNIELWSHCYNTTNGLGLPGANASTYDFDDQITSQNCYGSFQVHNYGTKQTLLAYNRWAGGGNSDLGIGNNTGNAHPDWTFMQNAAGVSNKKIYVFISGGVIADLNANTDLGLCSATVTVPTPTATDLCGTTTVTGVRSDALAITAAYPKGTTTITWTATDASSNATTITQKVIVADNEAPTIVGPSNINATATSAAGAIVSYATPTATDNCPSVSVIKTAGLASGSIFPIGVSTITYKATDAGGLIANYTFTVTVAGVAPVIVVPANIVTNTSVGLCSAIASFTATETTGVPASTISYKENGVTVNSGSAFSVGVHTITATATNAVGNSSNTFTITVNDVTPPVFTSTASIITANNAGVVQATSAAGAVVNYSIPTATDNCTSNPTVIAVPASGSVFPIGVSTVTVTATDNSGNNTQTSFVVTVVGLAPVIVVPSTITVNNTAGLCSGIASFAATETTGIPASTITYDIQPGTVFNVGTTKVTATATNNLGSSTASFDVVVTDAELPMVHTNDVTVYLDAHGNASVTATQINNNSSDNCGIASMSVTPNNFTCANLTAVGTQVMAYTGATNTGNQAWNGTLGMDFNVLNAGGIVISQLGAFDHNQNGITGTMAGGSIRVAVFNRNTQTIVPGLDVFIAGSGDPLVNKHRMRSITPVTLAPGQYSIVALGYNSAELNGNIGSGPSSITNTNGGAISFVNGGRFGPSPSTSFVYPQSLDGGPASRYHAGTFTYALPAIGNNVVLSVTDIHGNTGTATASVTVLDNIAPTITCPGNISVSNDPSQCSATVVITNATATDNCSVKSIVGVRSDASALSASYPKGITTIIWTATDASGNQSTCTQTITVTDTEAPVIAAIADINAIATSAAGAVVNYTAPIGTDNCPGATTVMTAGLASGSTFPIGTTVVTYTVTDASGLTASTSFNITVVGIAPVIVAPDNYLVNSEAGKCGASVSFAATETTAIPASTIAYTENGNAIISGNYFTVGTHIITATATNAVGSSSVDFSITVVDHEKPVVTSTDQTQTADAGSCQATVTVTAPVTSDNCAVASVTNSINGTNNASGIYSVGTTTITWTVTDIHGNVSIAVQNITVNDDEKPVVKTQNLTIQLDANGVANITAAQINNGSTDNCGIASYSLDKSSFYCSNVGINTVTLTVTDIHGNVNTATAMVTVQDLIAPVAIAKNITIGLSAVGGTATITAADINNGSTDACGIASMSVVPASFSCANIGANTVTLTVTDNNGNISATTAIVTVVDDKGPVPTKILANATGECYATVLTLKPGEEAEQEDDGKIELENYYLVAPTAMDNCSGLIVGTTTDPLTYYNQGTYIIHWKYVDAKGNVTIQEQKVVVSDDIAPTPKLKLLPTITGNCSLTIRTDQHSDHGEGGDREEGDSHEDGGDHDLAVPWAKDNCSGWIKGTTTDPLVFNAQGTYTIHWSYNDGHGNISTQNQTVIIKDNVKPVIKTPANTSVSCGVVATPAITGTATATDNCSGLVVITYTDVLSGTSIVRTWKATDAAGNYSTGMQTITLSPAFTASISSVPTSNIYTGSGSTNLYLGYGAQSTTLQVASLPAAGAPYSYVWTAAKGTAISALSSTSSAAPVFSATSNGVSNFTVIVTNKNGCTATATISICVTDIRVAGSNGAKVWISHSTNGKGGDLKSMSVLVSAVAAHLANDKGDRLGNTEQQPCSQKAASAVDASVPQELLISKKMGLETANAEEGLNVIVMPNPTTNYFTLKLLSKHKAPISLRVMDASGRAIEAKQQLEPNSTIQIGNSYPSGTFYGEFIQGNQRKVLQLIKARG